MPPSRKLRANSKKNKKRVPQRGVGVSLVVLGIALAGSILAPALMGQVGHKVAEHLRSLVGGASIFVAAFTIWIGALQFTKEKEMRVLRDCFLFFIFLLCLTSFLSLIVPSEGKELVHGLGGAWGDGTCLFLIRQFGKVIVFFLTVFGTFFSGILLLGYSPIHIVLHVKEQILEDIDNWKIEKKKVVEDKKLRKKVDKKLDTDPELDIEETVSPSAPPKIYNLPEEDDFSSVSKTALQNSAPIEQKEFWPESALNQAALNPSLQQNPEQNYSYDNYVLPDLSLLTPPEKPIAISKEELYANGSLLERTLDQFGVKAKVVDIHPGPVITRYDLTPAPGVRVQAIETLVNDIALAMKAASLRVLAPVPGKAAVGIEIPNPRSATVFLREILTSGQADSQIIPLALGKTTEGQGCLTDLCKTPHLLIAGATGSGKSVSIHALILSILFRFKPDEVKIFMVDPKRLELPVYDSIPHLYDPACAPQDVQVLTKPKRVIVSLQKLIEVMEDRYQRFANVNVRNIESYNQKAAVEGFAKEAYIVVIIDELADLMIVVGKEIEDLIQRLAQMARAAGIHLILATQRPSVDVITGVIKANLPSRIAFQVLSKTDSRVILDSQGAEHLLGRGDMLFLSSSSPKPIRLQGAFVTEGEVNRVVAFIKEQGFKPFYKVATEISQQNSIIEGEENLRLLIRAAKVVREAEKVSGDLLRSDKEIGSKYDMALTLLKKKGFIEKPLDSNRWRVHFDKIAEFLQAVDSEN